MSEQRERLSPLALLPLLVPLGVTAHDAAHDEVGGHLSGRVSCDFGAADGFPCARIDLLSWLDLEQLGGSEANDIWGWADPVTAREYVLIGRFDGTTFVDVSDPQAPVVLGYLPSQSEIIAARSERAAVATGDQTRGERCSRSERHDEVCGEEGSAWRDIKVHADHAYIVSEEFDHGLQVFDLTQLRGLSGPPVTFTLTAHRAQFGSAHNVAVDEASATLIVVGANTGSGGPIFYDLSDPAAPVFESQYSGDGYTHDAHCVVYAGPDASAVGRELCFASNEDSLTILDVTDKGAIALLARVVYDGVAYSHQAWLSEDHRYLYSNDELDELSDGHRTRTRIWDVSDLAAPRVVEEYDAPRFTIDHNNYVLGDLLFQSNYTSGLRVLDISDPTAPWEIGSFDTFPAHDGVQFSGSWSNYPYLPSGVIAISDTVRGLFLVETRFLGVDLADADLAVTFDQGSQSVEPGGRIQRSVSVFNTSSQTAPEVTLHLALELPATLVDLSTSVGSCELDGATAVCQLGALAAGGQLDLTLIADAGSTESDGLVEVMVAGLVDDPDGGDNRASLSVSIVASTPPPTAGGGGGGGGAWLLLAMLALLIPSRLRQRGPVPA